MSDNNKKEIPMKYQLENIAYKAAPFLEERDAKALNIISKAEQILSAGYDVLDKAQDEAFAVTSLGYDFDSENDTDEKRNEQLLKSMKFFSASCAARGDFTAGVENDGRPKYTIDCGDKDILTELLRSAYGTVSIEPVEKRKSYRYSRTAFIGRYDIDDAGVSKLEDNDNVYNWIDRVISAHIEKSAFSAKTGCVKISNAALNKRHSVLTELSLELSGFRESTINLGANSGENEIGALLSKINPADKGYTNGASFQLSYNQTNAYIEYLLKRISCELRRVEIAAQSGGYAVTITVSTDNNDVLNNVCAIVGGCVENEGFSINWRDNSDKSASLFLSYELFYAVHIPTQNFAGFTIEKNLPFTSPEAARSGIPLGNLIHHNIPVEDFKIPDMQFNRHAFICGMTGSGKTNTMLHLLTAINQPFLIIEPVKSEYRQLKAHMKEVKVYNMRAGSVSSIKLNPFWFPNGANVQFHIDSLKSLITSSFSLTAAMPNILEQCLSRIYSSRGWNTITNENLYRGDIPENELYPSFKDLADEVKIYLDNSEYIGEALATYRGALLTRLQSFTTGSKGMLFNTKEHLDYDELYRGHTIIELDSLPEDSDKAIVMGAILIQYYQYVKQQNKSGKNGLRHIIVIEEAHRLFKNTKTDNKNAEIANPQAQMVENLSNMMAEIRAYGEGIIIVDQCPTKISPDVIRNSNIKIVHRLDMKDDAELVEGALLLKQAEQILPRLNVGESLVRFEGMTSASLVRTPEFIKRPYEDEVYDESTVSWDYSTQAEALLNDSHLREIIAAISEKLLNHLLYDDLSNIIEVVSYTKRWISDVLSTYGFSPSEISLYDSDYNHLLITGVQDCIERHKYYRRFLKMKTYIMMLLRNVLRLSFENMALRKEPILLDCFRSYYIEPSLIEINSFYKNQNTNHRRLSSISDVFLCPEIACEMFKTYQKNFKITPEDVDKNSVSDFVDRQFANFFVTPVEDSLHQKLCNALFILISFEAELLKRAL